MGCQAASSKIPVLEFTNKDLKPGTSDWKQTCKDVREALEEYGCFIIEYHNKVPPQLEEALLNALKQVFDLPTETKMKNKYEASLKGYVGQVPQLPLHESVGIDNATDLDTTKSFTNLLWPYHGNEFFCENVNKYAKIAAKLDQMVTRMIFEVYGVEKYYEPFVDSITYLLKLIKTRPPKGGEGTLGFPTHTDKSFITVLHQFQSVNALQIDTKHGDKINVELSPTSFFVVADDALMVWSNDRIKSCKHRVLMNATVDRYSIALFGFHKGLIEVPEELVDKEHPLMYKPLDNIGLLRFYEIEENRLLECPVKAYCGI